MLGSFGVGCKLKLENSYLFPKLKFVVGFFIWFILHSDLAFGQFVSRDFRDLWSNEVFENYGTSGYRDYDFDEENRRFDYFGDLLIDGVDIVRYSEIRRNSPGIPGSYESRNARYDRFFDKLIVSNEGFGP